MTNLINCHTGMHSLVWSCQNERNPKTNSDCNCPKSYSIFGEPCCAFNNNQRTLPKFHTYKLHAWSHLTPDVLTFLLPGFMMLTAFKLISMRKCRLKETHNNNSSMCSTEWHQHPHEGTQRNQQSTSVIDTVSSKGKGGRAKNQNKRHGGPN